MTLNDVQRAALVLYAAREAGPDANLEQMKAICYIIRNRVRAGWYEGQWFAAMEESLSCAGNDPIGVPLRLEDRRLQALARDVDSIFFGNDAEDEIATACGRQGKDRPPLLYWCFVQRAIRPWFKTMIIGDPINHRNRMQIGFMMLYE